MNRLDTIFDSIKPATDDAGVGLCPQEAFMSALEKLLTVGAFYPPQHSRSLEVGRQVRYAMGKLATLHGPLRIETRRKSLLMQNIVLEAANPAINQWHSLLDQLAIAFLDIDPDISSLNLHHLATCLLSMKLEADSAHGFLEPNFDNLPPGITVTPRSFGSRREDEKSAQKIIQTVNEVLERMGDGDALAKGHQEYRELMENFFTSVVERISKDNNPLGAQASNSQRPIDEILQLGSQAIEHALQNLQDSQGELSELPQLFENAEFALAYATDKKTVQLMVDVLQQTISDLDESPQQKKTWVQDPNDYKLSLDELQEEMVALQSMEEAYTDLRGETESEYISIGMGILTAGFSKKSFQRTTRNLAEILSGHLNNDELAVLIDGTNNILQTSSLEEIDQIIPYLISPIHRAGLDREMRFWQELSKKGNATSRTAIWPHITLLLFTNNFGPDQLSTIIKLVTSLDTETMSEQLPRLEAMRGFQFQKFKKPFIAQAPFMLQPTLGVLMGSTIADNLGPLLHPVIATHTNNNLTKILMAACHSYDPANRHLYQLLLAESENDAPSTELKKTASEILGRIFANIEADRIEQPWVSPAITAYGALAGASARPLLEKVVSEKRMKLFHLWPDNCRKSAQKALQRLEHKTEHVGEKK